MNNYVFVFSVFCLHCLEWRALLGWLKYLKQIFGLFPFLAHIQLIQFSDHKHCLTIVWFCIWRMTCKWIRNGSKSWIFILFFILDLYNFILDLPSNNKWIDESPLWGCCPCCTAGLRFGGAGTSFSWHEKKYIYIILPKMKANVKSYSLHKFVTIVNGEQKRNAYHKQLWNPVSDLQK